MSEKTVPTSQKNYEGPFDLRYGIDKILTQREEIIKAFIAKYNLDPSECEQVIRPGTNGEIIWSVRKKGTQ